MFFKKKPVCNHDYVLADKYYNHELTEYINSSDSIELVAVRVCKNCTHIKQESIDKKYFPVNNDDSVTLKRDYLALLRANKVKTKEEYLLSILKTQQLGGTDQ